MKAILHQFLGGDGLESISPPCLRVGMALSCLGVDYELENLRSPGQIRAISRTGRLPVLEIEGQKIPDSATILDYLEARYPQGGLFPKDPAARRRSELWECYGNDHLYWCGYYLRWVDPEMTADFLDALVGRASAVQKFVVKNVLVPRQRKRALAVGIAGKTRDEILATMARGFEMVEEALESAPFLSGLDFPGRGDLAITSLFVQMGFRQSMKVPAEEYGKRKVLMAYAARVYDACKMEKPRWIAENLADS